jgi:hypothetical protein
MLSSVTPMMHAVLFVSMGVEARCRPSKRTAHCRHMKRQPFLCNGCPCRGRCHCHCRCHLRCHHRLRHHRHRRRRHHHCHRRRRHCHRNCPSPSLLPSDIAIAIPSTIAAAISVMLPSVIAIAVALAVGHCRLCHCRPSQLPSPLAITVGMLLAISESCCLGAAKIVFNQLKQRMLVLFYFVLTVGGALIKAG